MDSRHRGNDDAGLAAVVAKASWALLVLGSLGCTVKSVPPRQRLVDRVDVLSDDKPRVDPDDVSKHLATRETSHFPPFALFSGVPVLGMLDALTVEYNTFDRFVLQRDLERARRYYRSRGFYEAEVTAGRVVTTDKGHVRVEIVVKEGEPVFVGRVEPPVELLPKADAPQGEGDALLAAGGAVQNLINAFENKPIEDPPRCADKASPKCAARPRFDEERYEALKRDMQRVLTDAGFAYAEVGGKVDVDLLAHEAAVHFAADPGPLCTFGEVQVRGNGEIPEKIIRERLGFVAGQRYSTEKIDAAHDELAALGVFGSIEIVARLDRGEAPAEAKEPPKARDKPRPSAIPIEVNVQPIKLRGLRLGVGALVGSQLESHALIGWEDRNLLGGLRLFSVEARPGLIFFPTHTPTFQPPKRVVPKGDLVLFFKQPSFPERRTDMIARIEGHVFVPQIPAPDFVDDDDRRNFNILGYYGLAAAYGFERAFRFPRIDRSSVHAAAYLRAQFEFPFSYNKEEGPPAGYRAVFIPYLDVLASWDFRKDRTGKPTTIAPYRGLYTAFDFQVAFGNAIDLRIQPELRVYRPLAEKVVVALRWTTGLLFPFNYGDEIAKKADPGQPRPCDQPEPGVDCARDLQLFTFRGFYSGGQSSNRGYGFHEVGPYGQLPFLNSQRSQLTNQFLPTGGMGMWELSGELRFLVLEKFALVVFLDASDVVRALRDFRVNVPHLSPGAGLRLATPVGPLRLDVGFRPPYIQWLGHKQLPADEGGDVLAQTFPVAWSLAIGEAF